MHIVLTIVIGFLIGFVAKLLVPGRDPAGLLITTVLGVAGALLAKYLGVAMDVFQPEDTVGFAAAVLGAVVLLAVYHLFSGRQRLVHY
jgi:uncharacterized membrane protein YeaQ/YmgE (transglycosylase-associated protein family)